ncbi:MAG TPA: 2-oxoacid:acceptor oxidoreductase family protein, partial [Vampirovibrionales bacterium]
MNTSAASKEKDSVKLDRVVIRFAGDSGDGMQVTGGQFTTTAAILGNSLATFPDYPAEIRAPQGTLPGVSGFQVQFGEVSVYTAGDEPDVLVAMNPAALKVNLASVKRGGTIIVNQDAFTSNNLQKAGYEENPLDNESLSSYRVIPVQVTKLTRLALDELDLDGRSKDRCKNFFALGLMYWIYSRPLEPTKKWLEEKFGKKPLIAEANIKALQAGYNYGITVEALPTYIVESATISPGTYRNITGNEALALGLIAGSQKAELDLFLGSYPITPASDVLHELAKHKEFGVITFQAEDEIAAVCSAIGASYGGAIGLTSTSGPGLALKSEAVGLAIKTELPLVIINVQRSGPSTGMPTKTEQSDLLF